MGSIFTDALVREIMEETNLNCVVVDFCEAVQNDYAHKRGVQLIMYLENVEGNVEISEEHTDWMWVSLNDIKGLEISSSLEKTLIKRIGIFDYIWYGGFFFIVKLIGGGIENGEYNLIVVVLVATYLVFVRHRQFS